MAKRCITSLQTDSHRMPSTFEAAQRFEDLVARYSCLLLPQALHPRSFPYRLDPCSHLPSLRYHSSTASWYPGNQDPRNAFGGVVWSSRTLSPG